MIVSFIIFSASLLSAAQSLDLIAFRKIHRSCTRKMLTYLSDLIGTDSAGPKAVVIDGFNRLPSKNIVVEMQSDLPCSTDCREHQEFHLPAKRPLVWQTVHLFNRSFCYLFSAFCVQAS